MTRTQIDIFTKKSELLFLLWQQFEQEILALPLLLEVVRCPLLHEGLQVVGVLLHAGEQVVKDVAALAVSGNT